ncbi:MAG TPA: hypothetical protein VD735_04300 [Candidatus Saccharimonadales bacterium]|nr:hypothetical protein [Candidatus Saccharimonadales bacterium]
MNKMRHNQAGFAGIQVVVAIVVAALIVATGWFVWNSRQDNKDSSNKSTARTKSEPSCTASSTSQYCIERAPAENTKLSKLPTELQTVVKATYAQEVPACIKDGQIVDYYGKPEDLDAQYAPIGSAIVGIGCDGVSAGLFAKDLKTGEWKFLETTQMAFSCDTVFNNPVPKALLSLGGGAQCFTDDTLQKYDDASAERFL